MGGREGGTEGDGEREGEANSMELSTSHPLGHQMFSMQWSLWYDISIWPSCFVLRYDEMLRRNYRWVAYIELSL